MKKLLALFLTLFFTLSFLASCKPSTSDSQDSPSEELTTIRIGYMAGPTGIGMAKLIVDNNGLESGNEKYVFTKYADTAMAKADLAAGNIDVICLPTNEAAAYQSKFDKDAKILAVNCLNSLFLVSAVGTDSNLNEDLTDYDGKTIYTCKNGTPRVILEYILKELSINAEVSYTVDGKEMVTPADVSAQVIAGNIPNAVLPEPLISTIETKTGSNSQLGSVYLRTINFSDEWAKVSETPMTMGCLLVSGNFAKNHRNSLNAFLDEYKSSIEYISSASNFDSAAEYIQKTTIIPALPIARAALKGLGDSIVYLEGEEMKDALVAFYEAIGVDLPNDSIYYEK